MRCRIHTARRDPDYPPYGRQSDVTGTFYTPVTSPHFEPDDVMTSPDCVCAGSELEHESGVLCDVPEALGPLLALRAAVLGI